MFYPFLFFVYVYPNSRSDGKGCLLYKMFEHEVIQKLMTKNNIRTFHDGNSIEIRIPVKHCIKKCYPLWNKNGFSGDENSVHLSKIVYF